MSSPSPKRIKLEALSSPLLEHGFREDPDIGVAEEPDVEQCSICLQPISGWCSQPCANEVTRIYRFFHTVTKLLAVISMW